MDWSTFGPKRGDHPIIFCRQLAGQVRRRPAPQKPTSRLGNCSVTCPARKPRCRFPPPLPGFVARTSFVALLLRLRAGQGARFAARRGCSRSAGTSLSTCRLIALMDAHVRGIQPHRNSWAARRTPAGAPPWASSYNYRDLQNLNRSGLWQPGEIADCPLRLFEILLNESRH